jgi:uncharacterized repeat protein (TIGR03803 family)
MKMIRPAASLVFVTLIAASGQRAAGDAAGGQVRGKTAGDSAGFHLTVFHVFKGGGDGANSSAALIQATDGNFYGTTYAGGTPNAGTVFRMTPAGVVTIMHTFTGMADGGSPFAALMQAGDGDLYGTTYSGGASGNGTVFRMSLSGLFTTVYNFAGGSDGSNPHAALIQATDGNFYGTTQFGGTSNRGTLFGMTAGGVITVRYSFTGGFDGAYPYAPLIQAADGNLYGTCYAGDIATFGRVFKSTLSGVVTVMHTFTGGGDGADSSSPLFQTSDGAFYGTTNFGGASGLGVVFRVSNAPPTPFTDNTLTAGSSIIRAVHITELRTRIDAQRTRFGLAAYPYTDDTLTAGTTVIKLVHVTDLRTALTQVYDAVGLTQPTFTDPNLDGLMVKVAHIAELRAAVIDLE